MVLRRLHTRHVGHGLVGDTSYAADKEWAKGCDRMMLHAWRLTLPYEPQGGRGGGGSGEEGRTWGVGEGGRVWFEARDPLSAYVTLPGKRSSADG